MVNRRKVTLRELQSLIGLLSSGCLVAPCGRAFVRRFINLTIGLQHPHHYVTLYHEARADVHAWQLFLYALNGKSAFLDKKNHQSLNCIQTLPVNLAWQQYLAKSGSPSVCAISCAWRFILFTSAMLYTFGYCY